jgi:hypothetical protein
MNDGIVLLADRFATRRITPHLVPARSQLTIRRGSDFGFRVSTQKLRPTVPTLITGAVVTRIKGRGMCGALGSDAMSIDVRTKITIAVRELEAGYETIVWLKLLSQVNCSEVPRGPQGRPPTFANALRAWRCRAAIVKMP